MAKPMLGKPNLRGPDFAGCISIFAGRWLLTVVCDRRIRVAIESSGVWWQDVSMTRSRIPKFVSLGSRESHENDLASEQLALHAKFSDGDNPELNPKA